MKCSLVFSTISTADFIWPLIVLRFVFFFWCAWEKVLNQVVNLLWLISNPAKYSDFFDEHENSPVLREYSICIRGCMVGIWALKLYPSYSNRRHRHNNVLNETEATCETKISAEMIIYIGMLREFVFVFGWANHGNLQDTFWLMILFTYWISYAAIPLTHTHFEYNEY